MGGRFACSDLLSGLNTLAHIGVTGNLSDGQLLDRFLARSGETAGEAFEALVARHGPMVLDVCENILRDPHNTRDAFRPRFSYWRPRRPRSGGEMPSRAGSSGSRAGSRCGPELIGPGGACTKGARPRRKLTAQQRRRSPGRNSMKKLPVCPRDTGNRLYSVTWRA